MKHFDRYPGYYPYYKEAGEDYLTRVGEVARLVIDGDIPAVEDITYATVQKIKKLLMVIAENVPLEPNINKLASQLESTRDILCKPGRSRPADHHAEAVRLHGRREISLRSRRQRRDLRPDCRPAGQLPRRRRHRDRQRSEDPPPLDVRIPGRGSWWRCDHFREGGTYGYTRNRKPGNHYSFTIVISYTCVSRVSAANRYE